MRALILNAGSLSLGDVPEPGQESRPSECVIRVNTAGICGTDLELVRGYAEFSGIPGHEFVGTVVSAPPGADAWLGRRVVGEINIACGRCAWCERGVREHCDDRAVLGIRGRSGAFAEYITLPVANLHAVPDSLPDEVAVFAEPVAAACRILEQVRVDPDARVAVVGDGRLGLLTALVLRTTGASPQVFGKHPAKLALAERLGFSVQREASNERQFDIVVDATGRASGLTTALSLVRPRGTVILKSTFHGEQPLTTWPIVVDEVSIVGSRCGPFAPALRLLASGAVDPRPLISARYPLAEFAAAFAEARTALKVLVSA